MKRALVVNESSEMLHLGKLGIWFGLPCLIASLILLTAPNHHDLSLTVSGIVVGAGMIVIGVFGLCRHHYMQGLLRYMPEEDHSLTPVTWTRYALSIIGTMAAPNN